MAEKGVPRPPAPNRWFSKTEDGLSLSEEAWKWITQVWSNYPTGETVIPAAATQAEMEAASSSTVYVSPARLQYHPGVKKGWANFQGSGTVTLRESHNVSSITDVAVGIWNVNLATDMSTTTYCPDANGSATAITTLVIFVTQIIDEGSFQVHAQNGGGTPIDVLNIYASALGDQ